MYDQKLKILILGNFLVYHQALVHKIAKERTYLRNLTHLHAVFIGFLTRWERSESNYVLIQQNTYDLFILIQSRSNA